MTSTVKTVLIVGAAAGGAFLLLKALSPAPVGKIAQKPAATDLLGLNAIVGAASAFGNLFGGRGSSAPAQVIDTPGGFYVSAAEARDIAAYDAQGTASNPVFGIAGLDY